MEFGDYQFEALKTAIYPDVGKNPIYPILELSGELGEVTEHALAHLNKADLIDPMVTVLRLIVRTGQIAERIKKVMRDNDLEFTTERKDAIIAACFSATRHINKIAEDLMNGWNVLNPIWQGIDLRNCNEAIAAESGDLLYGIASLCSEAGVELDHCVRANLIKLADRQDRGVLAGDGGDR